ncbi:RnfABCDGE type electron transport complex subunit D [Granulosicoccus antarcticus]|uniref:Ion-translocating oxidoreductase complex subunit D n=1 Tax=Granulosicoccus antarcticus IMCC3135 TaxID=1192854 RepID=A0A2Z2NH62_9GAMM|nr:RnfABCDGE type electron transport complex subunit D [Granulosicoccus antarcticus]ASJ70423.1 Electron transport complex subunit RsxD [Granulosicoccus antarcticus IMCC3135]
MSTLTPDTKALNFPRRSVGRIMSHVMLALLPGTLVMALTIDAGVLFNVLVAILSALCMEAALLHLRDRPIRPALSDGSIALAAWLLALCVPPSLPLWQLIVGVGVMTTLGKHLYGGLGHNPFNPAMVAYAVLLVSFPVTMTDWSLSQDPEPTSSTQQLQADEWDAMSGATPLDRLREIRRVETDTFTVNAPVSSGTGASASANLSDTSVSVNDYRQVSTQLILHSPWIWVSIAWLCGGLYLLLIRVISWHIPISVIASLAGLYAGYGLLTSSSALPVLPALMSGAIMLGVFFIATDPVSAATSNSGKLVYGIGIGLFTFIIREFSSYPEGFAFAVLLMNTCVPLIDYLFTGPKGS